MNEQNVRDALTPFFPKSFDEKSTFLDSEEGRMVVEIIKGIDRGPISRTQANQLLHLCHEAGMSEGFFRYYFLTLPDTHPYPIDRVCGPAPDLGRGGVTSLDHVTWGLKRLFTDALLYWGNIRSAYRELRELDLDRLKKSFQDRRVDEASMRARGDHYAFQQIDDQDRYLISELACKAYDRDAGTDTVALERHLAELYRKAGKPAVRIGELLDRDNEPFKSYDPDSKYVVQMGGEDLVAVEVRGVEDIHREVEAVRRRFDAARPKAAYNTRLYCRW